MSKAKSLRQKLWTNYNDLEKTQAKNKVCFRSSKQLAKVNFLKNTFESPLGCGDYTLSMCDSIITSESDSNC